VSLKGPSRNRTLTQVEPQAVYVAAWTHYHLVEGLRAGEAHDKAQEAVERFWQAASESVRPTPEIDSARVSVRIANAMATGLTKPLVGAVFMTPGTSLPPPTPDRPTIPQNPEWESDDEGGFDGSYGPTVLPEA